MYTGGTTGMPKGVIWRQGDLMRNMGTRVFAQLGAAEPPATPEEAAALIARGRAGGEAPVLMSAVPLMHATGLFNSMGALLAGGRVVLARRGRLDPRHVWDTVASQRVRTLVVAGNAVCQPLVDELIAAERAGRPHDLSSLEAIVSSGTAMSDKLKRALHERASVTITDAIAASEGGPFASAVTSSVDDLPARFYPAPATRVFTADGTPVVPGSGQIGVLAFSGTIPTGYYKDAGKSTITFRIIDGVRYTIPGDLVQVEADGAIRFLGRGSGVINTGGEKVHPQEVEDALLAHPDVTDAAVVGVPDETWGERVVAVVATANGSLTETELRELVRAAWPGTRCRAASCCCPSCPGHPRASSRSPRSSASRRTAPNYASLAATFCSRTSPWAISLPESSVMSTRHSCWLRPWLRGTASTWARPAGSGRRKCVVFVIPTATCPRSRTAVLAPMLAALSTTVV